MDLAVSLIRLVVGPAPCELNVGVGSPYQPEDVHEGPGLVAGPQGGVWLARDGFGPELRVRTD